MQFEFVFRLYNDSWWSADGQVSAPLRDKLGTNLPRPPEGKDGAFLGVGGKLEPGTWSRVHATASTSSECAAGAHHHDRNSHLT